MPRIDTALPPTAAQPPSFTFSLDIAMFDDISELPAELRALSALHLRAARKAFAAVTEQELAARPDLDASAQSAKPAAKLLGFMHLALARPYAGKGGCPPPPEFFSPRATLAAAEALRKAGFNEDEPRIPAGNPAGGQWTGAGSSGDEPASPHEQPNRNGGVRNPLYPVPEPEDAAPIPLAGANPMPAITLPIDNPAIMGHIFRDDSGHVLDTPENRALLEGVAHNSDNYVATNRSNVAIYRTRQADGSQIWVEVYNGKITNGGVNQTPR